jgi:hypothetical protein
LDAFSAFVETLHATSLRRRCLCDCPVPVTLTGFGTLSGLADSHRHIILQRHTINTTGK